LKNTELFKINCLVPTFDRFIDDGCRIFNRFNLSGFNTPQFAAESFAYKNQVFSEKTDKTVDKKRI
jgi:hypothetical protein